MEIESVKRQPNEFGLQLVRVEYRLGLLSRILRRTASRTLVKQGYEWYDLQTWLRVPSATVRLAELALQRGTE